MWAFGCWFLNLLLKLLQSVSCWAVVVFVDIVVYPRVRRRSAACLSARACLPGCVRLCMWCFEYVGRYVNFTIRRTTAEYVKSIKNRSSGALVGDEDPRKRMKKDIAVRTRRWLNIFGNGTEKYSAWLISESGLLFFLFCYYACDGRALLMGRKHSRLITDINWELNTLLHNRFWTIPIAEVPHRTSITTP